MPAPGDPIAARGRWSWWVAIIVAALVFAGFELVDDHIGLWLRQISSVLAGWCLDLAGYPVVREGTILSTERFRFDVVPACSGESTLRTLCAAGVAWALMHPGLGGWRRLAAAALAVPLALAANGVRVAALVAIGDARLEPVEGVLHEVIGLCAFAVALGGLFLACEGLARRGTAPTAAGPAARWLGLALLAALLLAPAALWCVAGWRTSPLDHHGYAFLIAAVGLGWWIWRQALMEPAPRAGFAVVALGVLVSFAGQVLSINLLAVVAAALVLSGIVLAVGGWRVLVRLAPAAVLAGIAVPTVGFVLTRVSGWEGREASLVLRIALALPVLVLGAWRPWERRLQPAGGQAKACAPRAALIALLAVGLAGQLALANRGTVDAPLRLTPAYLQGEWVGEDLPIDAQSEAIIGRERVVMRRYHHEGRVPVEVILTTTGGDRHRAHPPEYCLTGAGWTITSEQAVEVVTPAGIVPASSLRLAKGAATVTLWYWFSDGRETVGTFHGMLGVDARRRFAGRRTDWALIRLYSVNEAGLSDFAASFVPGLAAGP